MNKEGYSDIQAADIQEYKHMMSAQEKLHVDPRNMGYIKEELLATQDYKVKHRAYMEFLSQKAKTNWIKKGDENTSLFHQSIKARKMQIMIYNIYDEKGIWCDNPEFASQAFLSYYQTLSGGNVPFRKVVLQQLVQEGPVVTDEHRAILTTPYTREEVKKALFDIPCSKAPGLDDFETFFYRDAWSVIGDDVIDAVLDTIHNGRILKEVNAIVITLIPKTKCPKNVTEFRPISCCNTLYKSLVEKTLYVTLYRMRFL